MGVLIPGLLSYAALLGTVTFLTQPLVLGVWSLAIGWLRMMTDSGQILGPLVMGALADAVDLSTPFLLGAALLTAMAWRCRRQASGMSAAVTTERRDS